jgi:hypothetical protein
MNDQMKELIMEACAIDRAHSVRQIADLIRDFAGQKVQEDPEVEKINALIRRKREDIRQNAAENRLMIQPYMPSPLNKRSDVMRAIKRWGEHHEQFLKAAELLSKGDES